MVSSRSQTGLQWFPACLEGDAPDHNYSDYLRWLCDSLYRLNIEYDIISDEERDFSAYSLLILPVLYSASDELLSAVKEYVRKGGGLITTFRSGFADLNLKIRQSAQPYELTECLGIHYDRFTRPRNVELSATDFQLPEHTHVSDWMELLELGSAKAVCEYRHPVWGGHPAVTINRFGKGQAAYLGCYFDSDGLDKLLKYLLPQMNISMPPLVFPLILRGGVNQFGQYIEYFFNYSNQVQQVSCPHPAATSLLDDRQLNKDKSFELPSWGIEILKYYVD